MPFGTHLIGFWTNQVCPLIPRLVPVAGGRAAYLDRFVAETVAALTTLGDGEDLGRRQVAHVLGASTWDRLADRWLDWLRTV
ncbi:MAG TPA: hypothetical protein VKJ47_21110 [Candidatus Binatia bacterium]|nr:hypothetical protein [Candidatus Binatia bacterium]